MAETATLHQVPFEQIVADIELAPLAISIAEQESDINARLAASQFIGALLLEHTMPSPEVPAVEHYSLMDAIKNAAQGDKQARKLVETNVRTDMVERTIKSGHVSEVELTVNEAGHIMQFGQTTEEIHANSLRHGSQSWQMQERTRAETRNKFRIDEAYHQGKLEDFAFVVISRAADNMSLTQMEDEGFFTDTMSWSLQVTTIKDGRLTVESAFVAGKQSRDAERTDSQAVARLGQALGINYDGKTATETLDMPILVPKSLMPNGAVDLVALADSNSFFGETKPAQDYVAYKQGCAEREANLSDRVAQVTDQLVAEASTIKTPRQATERLGKLSAWQMVEEAIVDDTIDARVFGSAAAYRIEHARHYLQIGDIEAQRHAMQHAKAVETSSSCPGAGKTTETEQIDPSDPLAQLDTQKEKLEDCDFVSKKCPVCGEKNAKTTVRDGVYRHVGKGCKG